MRLVFQNEKEETTSLPGWLGRDVPPKRELARELLEAMGREKSLDYLLRLHDREEARRQKRLAVLNCYVLCLVAVMTFIFGLVVYNGFVYPRPVQIAWLGRTVPIMMLCTMLLQLITYLSSSKAGKKTPMLSSIAQQNLITALLDYADSPHTADALCRATSYYEGDKNRLYYRLAYALSRLPNDPHFLTEPARRALVARLLRPEAGFDGEKESLPVLQAAITCYFARTGKPNARSLSALFRVLPG